MQIFVKDVCKRKLLSMIPLKEYCHFENKMVNYRLLKLVPPPIDNFGYG